MLREASDEVVAEEEAEGAWPEGSSRTADSGSCPSVPEVNEDSIRRGNSCANDPGGQPAPGGPTLVSSCSHALPPKAALPPLSSSLRAQFQVKTLCEADQAFAGAGSEKHGKCFKTFEWARNTHSPPSFHRRR